MSGGKPNLAALKPKFERISPKAGIKRLVDYSVRHYMPHLAAAEVDPNDIMVFFLETDRANGSFGGGLFAPPVTLM